jgi:hypothetical protein
MEDLTQTKGILIRLTARITDRCMEVRIVVIIYRVTILIRIQIITRIADIHRVITEIPDIHQIITLIRIQIIILLLKIMANKLIHAPNLAFI